MRLQRLPKSASLAAMLGSEDTKAFRFAVAFSFAGAHRDKVRAIAELVSAQLDPGLQDRSQGRVFFDEWFEHEILGDDMDVLVQRFYHEQSRMVVADLSEEYSDRPWCQAEARAIRALRFELDTARDETRRLRLLNIRLGIGEVPGVFNTTTCLDGANKTAEECADVILKRHTLLVARLGAKVGAPANGGGKLEAPIRASETDYPPAGKSRNWVWHSTLATRAAGSVSVLACGETLFAVALYWWIALRYHTHWHLVSSVFIAPLLLLRSPDSMKLGVQWFLKDWFGFAHYEQWPKAKRFSWMGAVALFSGLVTYFFAHWLSQRWLPGLAGWPLFGWAAAIEALSLPFAVAVAFAVAFVGTDAFAGTFAGADAVAVAVAVAGAVAFAGAGAVAVAFAGAGAVAVAVAGAGAGAGAVAVAVAFAFAFAVAVAGAGAGAFLAVLVGPGLGAGAAMRALFFRVAATLRSLPAGVRRLPENWRENNFLTDSFLPAELMPGIRDSDPSFALDSFTKKMLNDQDRSALVFYPLVGVFFFLPAFLYRLNIKATAWFWWPLAYLLKPTPMADAEGQQKQALCWPWTNPFQKLWIVTSGLLVVVSLTLHNLDLNSWAALNGVAALPLALKVLLAIDWTHLAPWHWAQWLIASAGVGMLVLAGNARSHDVNGNWREYRQRWPQNIRLMTGLQRLRTLATLALLLMALGALLLQERAWQTYLSVPASWLTALEQFYSVKG